MITKEKVKKEIESLSEVELEKVHLYLSSLPKEISEKSQISTFKLHGKLDNKNIRSVAYE
jgi:hypothetical protein